MNERILELARQSGGIDMTNHLASGTTTWIGTSTPEFLERFSQMIVQECLDQLSVSDPTEDFDKGIAWSAKQIKQHFGVE